MLIRRCLTEENVLINGAEIETAFETGFTNLHGMLPQMMRESMNDVTFLQLGDTHLGYARSFQIQDNT